MDGISINLNENKEKNSLKITLTDLKGNYEIILFFLAVLSGLGFGGFFGSGIDYSYLKQTDILFNSDFMLKMTLPVHIIVLLSLCSNFIYALCVFLMGFSAWGKYLLFCISVLKGFGIGVSAGYLISCNGLTGLYFYLLLILPGAFVSVIALIIQQKNAFELSKKIFSFLLNKNPDSPILFNGYLKIYFKAWGFSFLIMILSSVIDGVSYFLFSGFFNF